MTVPEIIKELKPKKKISRARLYVHMNALNIKPLGGDVRQIPQQYPADTPHRILLRLGLANGHVTVTPKLTSKLTSKKRR